MTMDEEQRAAVLGATTPASSSTARGCWPGCCSTPPFAAARTGRRASTTSRGSCSRSPGADPPPTACPRPRSAPSPWRWAAAASRVWDRVVDGTDLITEAEVTGALRTVTGLPLTAPAATAKEQKVLIGHPKP